MSNPSPARSSLNTASRQANEERRECPRLAHQLRVTAGGLALATTNLSTSGLQVECPGLLYGLLQPEAESRSMQLSMQFPDGQTVHVRCEVVYVAYYGYDYLLGLRFAEFEGEGRNILRGYCVDYGGPEFAAHAA